MFSQIFCRAISSSAPRSLFAANITTKRSVTALAATSPSRLLRKQRNQGNPDFKPRSGTMAPFSTPSSDPPKHEMQYFPGMASALPSESGEFRRVLWTGLYSQVVLMNIPVGGDIGEEIHTVDQILSFTSGVGLAQVGGREQEIKAGDMVIVPAGTKHQFLNTGPTPLILYTVYSPAEHKATTVHQSKEEGLKMEEEGKDEPPEWSQKSKAENEAAGLVKGE